MQQEMVLEIVDWGTPAYEVTLQLRDEVLRKPLGMSIAKDSLEGEERDIHIRACLGLATVGVLVLSPQGEDTLKMRQVAVDESLRGQQVGRRMVVFAEEIAREKGYARFVLNARQVAIPFYEKLGYSIISEEFTEVGIPHRKMAKLLQSE